MRYFEFENIGRKINRYNCFMYGIHVKVLT